MIIPRVDVKALRLLSWQLSADLKRFKSAIKPKLKEYGEVVRRKERELFQAGPLQKRTGKTRRYSEKLGGYHTVNQRTSRTHSHHRVVIRWNQTRGQWEAFVGPTPGGKAFYAKFHEKGTGARRTKAGASRGTLTAHPWMKPAGEATEAQGEEIMGSAFRKFHLVTGGA